jgi:hypothetical protein
MVGYSLFYYRFEELRNSKYLCRKYPEHKICTLFLFTTFYSKGFLLRHIFSLELQIRPQNNAGHHKKFKMFSPTFNQNSNTLTGKMEVAGRQGRRGKQLLDDVKEMEGAGN